MTDFFQQSNFFYVLVKENYPGSKKHKVDTMLRIVYWHADVEEGYEGHFVIYGKRPNSKSLGKYVPYRLCCNTLKDVLQFVQMVVSSDHNLAIELHQYDGYNDVSEDEYHIEWSDTFEDYRTELVAFDVLPRETENNQYVLDFGETLTKTLNVLVNYDVV